MQNHEYQNGRQCKGAPGSLWSSGAEENMYFEIDSNVLVVIIEAQNWSQLIGVLPWVFCESRGISISAVSYVHLSV